MPDVSCHTCMGTGIVYDPKTTNECAIQCPTCNGRGKVWKDEHKKRK